MSRLVARSDRHAKSGLPELRLETYDSLDGVRDDWRSFQTTAAGSPHQTYEWISTWLDRSDAGRRQEIKIVVGRDESGACVLLLPFGFRRHLGWRVLEWLGGDQGNYASGLFDREAWSRGDLPTLERLWPAIGSAIGPIDAVHLADQPYDLGGLSNPLAGLPHVPGPSLAHWFPLSDNWEEHYNRRFSSSSRRKLRRAERSLGEHGEIRFVPAEIALDERMAVLDWIMDRKRERFRELGIADMFADEGTRAFYRALVALPHRNDTISIRVQSLYSGDALAAANLGLVYQNRFYGLVSATTNGPLRDSQPGKHLFAKSVAQCAEEGVNVFDCGVGNDDHKLRWCTESRRLFHTLIPVTAAGWAYVHLTKIQLRAKATIKGTPQLWAAFQRIRRLSARQAGSASAAMQS